jgi:hypothetical protein
LIVCIALPLQEIACHSLRARSEAECPLHLQDDEEAVPDGP